MSIGLEEWLIGFSMKKKIKTEKYKKMNSFKKDYSSANELLKEVEEDILTEEENLKEKIYSDNTLLNTISPLDSSSEIPLNTFEPVNYKRCPKCNSRIKKTKVKSDGRTLIQIFKCRNKTCDFFKEIKIGL